MSGCCGQGPVIISGAAATPRVDVETVLLCDVLPDGTVAGLALVEPIYDTISGDRVGTRIVDPATGTAYSPTGTLSVCGGPDQCARQIETRARCDDADGDGTGEVTYVEVWALDPCSGEDPELLGTYEDGDFATPYAPVTPVDCPETTVDTPVVLGTVCYLNGTETRTAAVLKCAACTDPAVTYLDVETGATVTTPAFVSCAPPERSTIVLCDVATDGTSTPFLRHYSDDGTTTTFTDTLLDGATAYAPAGTVGVCQPVSDCASPTTPITSVGLCLVDGTPIAVTVVRGCDGVVSSEGWLNLTTGAWTAGTVPTGTVACGDSQSVQVSGTFCDVDAAGEVVGLVLVEYSYAADGTIDSVRLVDAVTGATYTPTGTVTVCPAGVEMPEQDVVLLCDTATDGTTTPFVRDYRRDEVGAITAHSDYTLDGATYTPTGEVGICAEPCRHPETLTLCDSTPMDLGPDLTYASTDPTPYFQPNPPDANNKLPALVSGQPFWDGGSVTIAPAAGEPDSTHRYIAALIGGPACPPCGTSGDVELTLAATVLNTGPTGGVLTNGRWRLMRGSTEVAVQTISNTPLNTPIPLSITATVPFEELAGGDLAVTLDLETSHNGPKTWTASAFTVTAELTSPGCGQQFLRTLVHDCATGDVLETLDTDLTGAPYTPVEPVGTCQPGNSCTPTCQDCETLVLCDGAGDPATIAGMASSGTLANGVAWTATGPSGTGQGQPPRQNNSDGSWWGLHSFPFTQTSPSRWNFSRPSVVEFSIYLNYDETNPAINTAQLPAGLEAVHLPEGYAYNAATGVLTRTADAPPGDPCTYVTTPQVETTARFRTPGPVTTFTTAPALNSRVALCGTFFTYWVGAIEVSPGAAFLRTICRDCDGSVVSVTDTLADGVTPYTPTGTVGACQQEPPCDKTVLSECTYRLPDTVTGFDTEPDAFPGCWLGTALNPTYAYGDRVTSWEGTYQSTTGTGSSVGFQSPDIGGAVNFSSFTPAIPALPGQSAPGYQGTATFNGITVTLTATAGNGLSLAGTLLSLQPGDRFRIEFSEPVRLTLTTNVFADPPTPHNERLCGVVAETVPWAAVKLADCEGVITVIDQDTREPLPATATVECDCCQPVQVCISATDTETIEFISNEAQVDDDSIDTVWTWTNAGDANGPAAGATWYQMYRARYGFAPAAWSVIDSAPVRKAGWISPHPNGATTSTGAPGEGPSLGGTPANPMRWWARAGFSLPAAADPDSIRVQITVLNADQIASRFRLNTGAWTSLPASATYNGTAYTFGPGTVPGAQPGTNTLYFEVLETVADNAGNGAGVMAHFIVTYDAPGLGQRSWTQLVCCDGSVRYLDEFGERQEALPPSASVVPCGSSAQPMLLCDDDGPFIRHVSYVGDQVLTTDTDLNGSTYAPVGPVRSCGA
ncbi:hypothetical protein ACFWXA_30810 [Streptomyces atroolivaceus]|uniref:hypothetical protein n=1 Tax=Streptomyces atroolivaceus TaxID=66869 RepID=UPI003664A7B8